MINHTRRRLLESKIWPHVQTPAQYVGGERNIVVKDHRSVRGKLCLGFPDAYTIGMSHHGLQVLYSLMNRRDDWCAERVFTPWPDMEALLRRARTTALQPGNVHGTFGVRRRRFVLTVRNQFAQRADDDRIGRHSAGVGRPNHGGSTRSGGRTLLPESGAHGGLFRRDDHR